MSGRVLVTGATGNVGSELLRRLTERGAQAVGAARTPDAARPELAAEWVELDFEDVGTFVGALAGVDRVFLVRPPAIAHVRAGILPFLDAAAAAGVRQVVFLSLLGAEKNRLVPHRAIEDHLRAGSMDWTFLRAGFFMQNLSTTHLAEIREGREIAVPAGEGRTSFVDVRDLAEVAARVLTEPGHERRAYDLTGPEALTYAEVARTLSDVSGKPVAYRPPSLVGFVRRWRARGEPWARVAVMAGIYTTARLGLAARIGDDLPALLERAPTTLRRFADDHRRCWAPDGTPS